LEFILSSVYTGFCFIHGSVKTDLTVYITNNPQHSINNDYIF